jgi:flagellar hook-associated protein 2
VGGFGLQVGSLDVSSLVSQLMWAERAPVRQLDSRISSFQSKIDAYNKLNSHLSELLSSLGDLNDSEVFSSKSTASSDESSVTASASGSAAQGTYQIQVDRLALYDNLASDHGFSASSDTIGTGSFDLVIDGSTYTITIDSSNNTLDGLRKAINASGAAVNAGIIYDGSGYRLTVTSEDSGSANAIAVANNTLTLSDGSTPLSFSRTHDIADVSELDASFTVNGLAVTSSSNQADDVIEGVTVNLKNASATNVTLTVTNDKEAVKGKIEAFVSSYNKAYQFLNSQFEVVGTNGRAGTLAGDSTVRTIQSQLGSVVSGAISGLSGDLTTLGSAGIELQNDGTLSVNSADLEAVLDSNFDDIAGLFAALGQTTNARVSFVSNSTETVAGTYQVDISVVPEAATVTAPGAIGATLGVDEILTFAMGSGTSAVNLTSDMTLAQVVQAINTQLEADGLALFAEESGTSLVLTSDQKGESVTFTVASNIDGAGTGIGTVGLSDTGVSVAGTFTDTATSTVYEATGSGEILTGSSGDASELKIRFTGSSTGTFGDVSLSLGFAAQLSQMVTAFTDSLEGPIHTAIEGYESNIRSIKDDIINIEDRLTLRERYLTDQFTQANQALQQLSYLQSSLGSQLSSLL